MEVGADFRVLSGELVEGLWGLPDKDRLSKLKQRQHCQLQTMWKSLLRRIAVGWVWLSPICRFWKSRLCLIEIIDHQTPLQRSKIPKQVGMDFLNIPWAPGAAGFLALLNPEKQASLEQDEQVSFGSCRPAEWECGRNFFSARGSISSQSFGERSDHTVLRIAEEPSVVAAASWRSKHCYVIGGFTKSWPWSFSDDRSGGLTVVDPELA